MVGLKGVFADKLGSSEMVNRQAGLVKLWGGILITAFLVASPAVLFSTSESRANVSTPLLISVITLFTISLTVTITSVQLASRRYSHRINFSALQKWPVAIHFGPHLISISIAILMISTNSFGDTAFFLLIFSSSLAVLSIFPFLMWSLKSLETRQVFSGLLSRFDTDYLAEVENAVIEEREEVFEKGQTELRKLTDKVQYLHIREDDPVDAYLDILRSSLENEDTSTIIHLMEIYISHINELLKEEYDEFLNSYSDGQLVTWYLFGPLIQLSSLAIKKDNLTVTMEVVTRYRMQIQDWMDAPATGVPEAFISGFGDVTLNFSTVYNGSQARALASDYSSISKLIASDLSSEDSQITSAMRTNFEDYSLEFALRAIENGYYRAASVVNSGLRVIVEATIREPAGNPERTLLAMGLIGEAFAIEDAIDKQIVEIANEVTVRNYAEWTIVELVTFKDKLEEDTNEFSSSQEILDIVMREIDRVNGALEDRDRELAMESVYDTGEVLEVIRASRLIRSSFTHEELFREVDSTIGLERIVDICESLEKLGALTGNPEEGYTTNYERASSIGNSDR